ncbi:MAG: NUDIX hydrolase [bacterium]|nr:NUDIX hydrolase [bacterium]
MVRRWEKLGTPELIAERFGKRMIRQSFRSPETDTVEEFALIERPDWVMVLPITEDGSVITIREYKQGCDDITVSLPAGGLDAGEEVEATARRELEEETGYRAAAITPLGFHWMESRNSGTRGYCVLATGCVRIGDHTADPNEPIDIVLMSLDTWVAMVVRGEVTEPGAIVTTVRAFPHLGYDIDRRR